jgi:hypothetical protein
MEVRVNDSVKKGNKEKKERNKETKWKEKLDKE